MREREIERKVCDYAKGCGWLAFKWQSQNNSGVPDRLFFRGGRTVAVEFKAPGAKPTPLQASVHRRLLDHGVEVHVIDSVEAGKAVFRD